MNCMKCGRETGEGRVFCEACLTEMEKYPVKPGTVVQLPRRRNDPVGKKNHPRRKAPPALEEQVRTLRRQNRILIAVFAVTLALLAVTGYFTVQHLLESEGNFLPGQNYSAVTSTEPQETE